MTMARPNTVVDAVCPKHTRVADMQQHIGANERGFRV
jgi:hypothetical protein